VSKTVTVSIPSWVDKDEFRRIVEMIIGRLEGRVSAEELRRRLGVRPEDLAEDLDAEAPARGKPRAPHSWGGVWATARSRWRRWCSGRTYVRNRGTHSLFENSLFHFRCVK
jgi:hypothetical protein